MTGHRALGGERGKIAEQGFATADPYQYQYTIKQWLKPISFQLVSAVGYNPYGDSLATLPANVTKYAACFREIGADNPTGAGELCR